MDLRAPSADAVFTTNVPARLDRLPWSRFHWLVIAALGITWILDGLEVTLVGSLSGAIADERALDLSSTQIGLAASPISPVRSSARCSSAASPIFSAARNCSRSRCSPTVTARLAKGQGIEVIMRGCSAQGLYSC